MRLSVVLISSAVALLAAQQLTLVGADSAPVVLDTGRVKEVRRIQRHFDRVLVELRTRDVSSLTHGQRANREALVTTLRAYRDRGEFPHNYDFPGQAVPYFVDRKTGTLCAVAHLLESTGRRDIVNRVARADNNVWVAELAEDHALGAWLGEHGLTLEEAARIQVPYMGDESPVVQTFGSRNNAYKVGSAVTIATSAAATLWNGLGNSDGRRMLPTVVGVTTGALAMGFGAVGMRDRDAPRTLTALSAAAGGVSAIIAARGFLRHRQVLSAQRQNTTRASITPILPVPGQSGAGVALNVTF
jgi:hypothetical protein